MPFLGAAGEIGLPGLPARMRSLLAQVAHLPGSQAPRRKLQREQALMAFIPYRPGHAPPCARHVSLPLHKHTCYSAHHKASVGARPPWAQGWGLQQPLPGAQPGSRGLRSKSLITENKRAPSDRDNGPAVGWGSPQSYFDLVS